MMRSSASKRATSSNERSELLGALYQKIVVAEMTRGIVNLSHGNPLLEPHPSVRDAYHAVVGALSFSDHTAQTERGYTLSKYLEPPHTCFELLMAGYQHFRRNDIPLAEPNLSDPLSLEVTAGNGVTQLLMAAFHTLLEAGEQILVPWPCYGLFQWSADLTDNEIRLIAPNETADYKLTGELLEQHLREFPEAKCILLTNPNNPTGSVYTAREYEALAAVLLRPEHAHVHVVVDECYEKILIDPQARFVSFASIAGMYERTITLTGVSKNAALAGERIGLACGPSRFIWPISLYVLKNTFGASLVSQVVVARALNSIPDEYFQAAAATYAAHLVLVEELVAAINRRLSERFPGHGGVAVKLTNRPQGGFFCCLRFDGIRGWTAPDGVSLDSDVELFDFLLERAAFSVIVGQTAGFPARDMIVRVTFANPKHELRQAFAALGVALETLRPPDLREAAS
jgi:aspartate aminotransferase